MRKRPSATKRKRHLTDRSFYCLELSDWSSRYDRACFYAYPRLKPIFSVLKQEFQGWRGWGDAASMVFADETMLLWTIEQGRLAVCADLRRFINVRFRRLKEQEAIKLIKTEQIESLLQALGAKKTSKRSHQLDEGRAFHLDVAWEALEGLTPKLPGELLQPGETVSINRLRWPFKRMQSSMPREVTYGYNGNGAWIPYDVDDDHPSRASRK